MNSRLKLDLIGCEYDEDAEKNRGFYSSSSCYKWKSDDYFSNVQEGITFNNAYNKNNYVKFTDSFQVILSNQIKSIL